MERVHIRYSDAFKRQVVLELEEGRFSCLDEARRHYGIGGASTVAIWVRRFGRNHLLPKVVLVQTPDDKNELERLRRELAQTKQALAEAALDNSINRNFLKILCRQTGTDLEEFKKKTESIAAGTAAKKDSK